MQILEFLQFTFRLPLLAVYVPLKEYIRFRELERLGEMKLSLLSEDYIERLANEYKWYRFIVKYEDPICFIFWLIVMGTGIIIR